MAGQCSRVALDNNAILIARYKTWNRYTTAKQPGSALIEHQCNWHTKQLLRTYGSCKDVCNPAMFLITSKTIFLIGGERIAKLCTR